MKQKLLFLLTALMLLVTGNAWGAGYTRTLTDGLEVAGYQAKVFYNFQTNTPAVLPTEGNLRFRAYEKGGYWGLHNFAASGSSATATIPVAAGDILIIQEYNASYVTTINRGSENATLTTSTGYRVFDITTTADDVTFSVPRYGGIVAALVMEPTETPTHNYTINAVSSGATIGKLAEGIAEESSEYGTFIPKYLKYNDQYYVLNDANISNYYANYTMGQSDETKEINYSSSDIDYFFEAEVMTLSRQYGDNTNNAAYSKGAGKGVYGSATLTSISKVAAGVYTVAVTGVVRNSSKDVNFSISYSSKGGTWWSTGKNVTYKTNSSGAATGNVTEVIIPSESYIRLTEATGSNANDYTDYVTLEKTRDLSAVEIAVIDCKRYDTSSAFATAIDAGSFSTAAEVYAFNTSYHVTNGVLIDGVRDITGVIRNAQVNDADATDWDGAGTYSNQQYTGAPDPYFIDNNGSQMWATQWIYGLPAGRYQVKVATRGAAANYNHIYINNGTADIAQVEGNHVGNTGGDLTNGWSWTYVPFEINETTNLIFGFYKNATNWAGCDDWHLYRIESVSKTITSAKWATYCSPYILDFSSAIEHLTAAYIVTDGNDGVLTLEEVDGTVPANTGLLLKGEGNCVIPVAASSSTNVDDNKLVGVTSNTQLPAEEGYVLMASPKLGFYKNVNAFTVGANTAYLPINFDVNTPGARSAFFGFEEDPTAINAIEATEAENGAPKDGKYFIGNKIVLVKNGVKYDANGKKLN